MLVSLEPVDRWKAARESSGTEVLTSRVLSGTSLILRAVFGKPAVPVPRRTRLV